jgi:hypothetical protein
MAQTATAYAQAGAADRLDQDLFPGVHQVSGRRMFDWLDRTLRADSTPG